MSEYTNNVSYVFRHFLVIFIGNERDNMNLREILDEYYSDDNLKQQKYYHGTSTVFQLDSIQPPEETGYKRESFRNYNDDVVYVTTSLLSAQKYAFKAAQTYGGEPIVYEVKPDFDSLTLRINNEYITKSAEIISKTIVQSKTRNI